MNARPVVSMVSSTVRCINSKGAVVRMPVKGREGPVEVNSKTLPGKIVAKGPAEVNPRDFDLVGMFRCSKVISCFL